MRKIMITLVATALICGMAYAVDSHGHNHGKCLNNVVSVNDKGEQTAMCGCGMEFAVTDKTPSMDANGFTVYACGEGCATKMAGMDDKMKASKLGELQMAVTGHEQMVSNVHMKDDKKMATCACGGEFAVSAHTNYVVENGVKMYMCGSGCATHFSEADSEMRTAAQDKARAMIQKSN